jgi:hypothetical protein
MTDHRPTYGHTQRAPLCLILYALSIIFLALAWLFRTEPVIPWMFPIAACVTLVLAGAFHQLTVEDAGDSLSVRFGPVAMFRRTVRYEDMSSVEVSQTTLLDGWGIHMSLQGGWVWNLWGRDCVVIRMANGTLRVGSDDSKQLAIFLKGQMTGHSETG